MPLVSPVASMRVLLAAIVVAGCAASSKKISSTAPAHAGASCPDIEHPKPDSAPPIIHIDDSNVARSQFVSVIIDGQWAEWNAPNSARGGLEANAMRVNSNPTLERSDIEGIEVFKPALAQHLYYSCPGVAVVVIRTKGGKWRPISPTP